MKFNWRSAEQLGLLLPEGLAILARGELPPIARYSAKGEAMRLVNMEEAAIFHLVMARDEPKRLALVEEFRRKAEIERARPLTVRIVSIGVGVPLRFSDFGAGRELLFVNEASMSSGIRFTVVDPGLLEEVRVPNVNGGKDFIHRIPHTVPHRVASTDGRIPDSAEKGVYLTAVNRVQVYLTTMGASQNTFRLAVRYDPNAKPIPAFIPPASRPGFVP